MPKKCIYCPRKSEGQNQIAGLEFEASREKEESLKKGNLIKARIGFKATYLASPIERSIKLEGREFSFVLALTSGIPCRCKFDGAQFFKEERVGSPSFLFSLNAHSHADIVIFLFKKKWVARLSLVQSNNQARRSDLQANSQAPPTKNKFNQMPAMMPAIQ